MTIRFKCDECDSVLKIKDELAGTKAKCPKCGNSFVIPQPPTRNKATISKSADPEPTKHPQRKAKATEKSKLKTIVGAGERIGDEGGLEDLVDMPREITPRPVMESEAGFDPLDVLSDSAGGSGNSEPEELRPSVADLMREHQEAQEAKKAKRSSKKSNKEEQETKQFTAGTASDALSRSYDQKREKAGEAPAMTREERREAEYRKARNEFAVKAGGGLTALGVVLYFMFSWLMGPTLPDLEYVSGVITLGGAPASGMSVTFSPIDQGGKGGTASSSTAYSDASGKYVLKFRPEIDGAVPGKHRVFLMDSSGFEFDLPPDKGEVTVVEGQSNTIDFQL